MLFGVLVHRVFTNVDIGSTRSVTMLTVGLHVTLAIEVLCFADA